MQHRTASTEIGRQEIHEISDDEILAVSGGCFIFGCWTAPARPAPVCPPPKPVCPPPKPACCTPAQVTCSTHDTYARGDFLYRAGTIVGVFNPPGGYTLC